MGTWIADKVFNTADEFIQWLDKEFGDYITQHISENHVHHTWSPNHSHYPKYTTLQLHKNMRKSHVNNNGWDDIAQHVTIGKEGQIVLGRDIRKVPVSAKTHNGTTNWHPFAYEMIGNFDSGNDKLEGKQLESAIKISRYFYKKNKPVMFHRELLLYGKVPKTCPGTGVDKTWFMNLVKVESKPATQTKISGWVKNNLSQWTYYVNGELQKSRWILDIGKWYWVDENGVMKIGWIKVKDQWFYLAKDGSMQVGWLEDNGKKYFLQSDGVMKVGWLKDEEEMFYFNKDGSAISKGWNCLEGKWFCFGLDGHLLTDEEIAATSIKVNSDGSISEII